MLMPDLGIRPQLAFAGLALAYLLAVAAGPQSAQGQPVTGRDLMISAAPTITPLVIAPGGSITVSAWTVRNQGTLPTASSSTAQFRCEYYISLDSTISTSDISIGYYACTTLAAGAQRTIPARTISFPSTTPEGTYYIGVAVDSTAKVGEAIETNNLSFGLRLIISRRPDLNVVASGPLASPTMLTPWGRTYPGLWIVRNQGPSSAGAFYSGYYLSPDPVISSADTRLDSSSILCSGLASGAQQTFGGSGQLIIPGTTPPGTYYLGVLVDRAGNVAEANEANNYATIPITIISGPDLTVSTSGGPLKFLSQGIMPGSTLPFPAWTVRNMGAQACGTFYNRYYLSVDPEITSSDIPLASNTNPGLAPGASTTWPALDLRIPAGTAHGWYYVGVLADYNNRINNENYDPNNFISGRIYVGPLPDLTITTGNPTVTPARVIRGGWVTLAPWAVRNQGNADSGAFYSGYYISTNSSISADDQVLTQEYKPTLYPGAQQSYTPMLQIPAALAPGVYYFGIFVDNTEQVVERIEHNNTVARQFVVDDYPDVIDVASEINTTGNTSGTIQDSGDVDWFKVHMYAGTKFKVTLTRNTLPDATLTLYSSFGKTQEVGFSNDAPYIIGSTCAISYTAPLNGFYYIKVAWGTEVGPNTGTYTLSVR